MSVAKDIEDFFDWLFGFTDKGPQVTSAPVPSIATTTTVPPAGQPQSGAISEIAGAVKTAGAIAGTVGTIGAGLGLGGGGGAAIGGTVVAGPTVAASGATATGAVGGGAAEAVGTSTAIGAAGGALIAGGFLVGLAAGLSQDANYDAGGIGANYDTRASDLGLSVQEYREYLDLQTIDVKGEYANLSPKDAVKKYEAWLAVASGGGGGGESELKSMEVNEL